MRILGPRLLMFLTVSIGGGSLVLFAYFLLFGVPFAIRIAHSHAARLAWDSLLCVAFFLQHSGMIRRGAKERIAKRVPRIYYPAFYSIASGTALCALILLWQPTDQFLFRLHGLARWLSVCLSVLAVAGFAWGVHSLHGFDPFGTLSLKAHLRGALPSSAAFVAHGPYRYVRHPLYLFMLLLIWSTPRLSTDQLLFNVLWSAWIVLGAKLEERDLLVEFGETYRRYQRRVPMLIPSPRAFRRHTSSDAAS
jgi:protein-S-isoprenylcysteine O-methyltransferase Ste14